MPDERLDAALLPQPKPQQAGDGALLPEAVQRLVELGDQGATELLRHPGPALVQAELVEPENEPHQPAAEELAGELRDERGVLDDVLKVRSGRHVLDAAAPVGRLEHHPLGAPRVEIEDETAKPFEVAGREAAEPGDRGDGEPGEERVALLEGDESPAPDLHEVEGEEADVLVDARHAA